jgi:hypothetical protein
LELKRNEVSFKIKKAISTTHATGQNVPLNPLLGPDPWVENHCSRWYISITYHTNIDENGELRWKLYPQRKAMANTASVLENWSQSSSVPQASTF